MSTQNLKQLFWDVNEKDLSLLGEEIIISRALSHGTFAQIRELFSAYDRESIVAVFMTLKPGALSERRHDYFKLILS